MNNRLPFRFERQSRFGSRTITNLSCVVVMFASGPAALERPLRIRLFTKGLQPVAIRNNSYFVPRAMARLIKAGRIDLGVELLAMRRRRMS